MGLTVKTKERFPGKRELGYKAEVVPNNSYSNSMVTAYDDTATPILVQLKDNGEWSNTSKDGGGDGFTGGGRRGEICFFT